MLATCDLYCQSCRADELVLLPLRPSLKGPQLTYDLEMAIPSELGLLVERDAGDLSYADVYDAEMRWRPTARRTWASRGREASSSMAYSVIERLLPPGSVVSDRSLGFKPSNLHRIAYKKPSPYVTAERAADIRGQRRGIYVDGRRIPDDLSVSSLAALIKGTVEDELYVQYFYPLLKLSINDLPTTCPEPFVSEVVVGCQLELHVVREPEDSDTASWMPTSRRRLDDVLDRPLQHHEPTRIGAFFDTFFRKERFTVSLVQLGGPNLAIGRFNGFPLRDALQYVEDRWATSPKLLDPNYWAVLGVGVSTTR